MAGTEEIPPNVFPVSGSMPAGHWHQVFEASEHHIRYRERHGEPGVAAICDGPDCTTWSIGLEDGHDLEAMARLESQHTGTKVTIVREAA